jgi:ATP-dependent Clp protease protease subunit
MSSFQDALTARLFERRTVVVRGILDDAAASDAAAALMTLDASGDEPVTLHLDCAATEVGPAFVLVDTIDLMGVPVHAVCLGRLEGPAVAVLAVAHRRSIARHAHVRLTEPAASFAGHAGAVERFLAEHQRQAERFARRLAEATGRPIEHVEADLQRGRWLDAEEAIAYGMADEVLGPDPIVGRAPFGFRPPGS